MTSSGFWVTLLSHTRISRRRPVRSRSKHEQLGGGRRRRWYFCVPRRRDRAAPCCWRWWRYAAFLSSSTFIASLQISHFLQGAASTLEDYYAGEPGQAQRCGTRGRRVTPTSTTVTIYCGEPGCSGRGGTCAFTASYQANMGGGGGGWLTPGYTFCTPTNLGGGSRTEKFVGGVSPSFRHGGFGGGGAGQYAGGL